MHAKHSLKSGGKKRRNNLKTVGSTMVNTISLLSSLLFSLHFGGDWILVVLEKKMPSPILPPTPLLTTLIIHFLSTRFSHQPNTSCSNFELQKPPRMKVSNTIYPCYLPSILQNKVYPWKRQLTLAPSLVLMIYISSQSLSMVVSSSKWDEEYASNE